MDVRAALKKGISDLRKAHVPSFTLAAELLLLHVVGHDRAWLYAHPEEIIPEEKLRPFLELIARRASGEPTQHLTGKQEFWSLEFEVTSDVLIPRPETEHVVEVALDRLALRELHGGRSQRITGQDLQIADIGTGSGCIAIALAKELPAATIYASDISPAALAVARRNAERHQVSHRIHFFECSLLNFCDAPEIVPNNPSMSSQELAQSTRCRKSPATNRQSLITSHQPPILDLIVSNPPYIGRYEAPTLPREVRDHEPEIALYGGEKGYELYAELIAQSLERLKPGGLIVLELGYDSLVNVKPLLDTGHWTNIGVTDDLAGIPRVIGAERLSMGFS